MVSPGSHLFRYHLGKEIKGALLHLRDGQDLNLYMDYISVFGVQLYIQYTVFIFLRFLFDIRINDGDAVVLVIRNIQDGFKELREDVHVALVAENQFEHKIRFNG